ncbi:mRNA degradation ribonuclease J1/J2 (RnjA) (PDB:3T3N) [Commensalibacter communis]|uniref:ribonuclease J n=1 Tax=Commensalibacter communis TaxID=2972786 RepID=UPI0022FF987F|nr:ribonuclease J [Commensalibacter communis]CAI3925123.1 mRNA degradation ribonuclease J1/J2 (RnjA) (PDB:3T3N) [Commensalibacter communis]CAI3934020.1 mRNA degradation ribonuclease J1/J2 (RnjA) (PDB:3T3N) [Commensalibacter communis]
MNEQMNDFAFLPLGGTGEIGMNFNLYRLNGKWLAIDCGIGFSGNDMPEADILVPDPEFIARHKEDLLALVITHAHEDHIGAVTYLWQDLECPVYATKFAASILRRKLREAGMLEDVTIHLINMSDRFNIGEFDLEFIPVTHSIPEAQSVFIRTPYGNVLHTGDWKLDPEPVIGNVTNLEKFAELGREGVLAMVCDSTNVIVKRAPESEMQVRRSLVELIASIKGRVAVTCFASNVSRVESIAYAAKQANRPVVIIGRSLKNLEIAARENGYLADIPPFFTEQNMNDVDLDHVVFIVTGSQGEERSALTRISFDVHQHISFGNGDTVIYSSRTIPGNELAIMRVQDNLARRGARVITSRDHFVHASGHACYEEVCELYKLVQPTYGIPVHGEWIHLNAQANVAKEYNAEPILLEDGDILRLGPGKPQIVAGVPCGRLVIDGNRLLSVDGDVLSARRRMLYNGVVVASFAVNMNGDLLSDPNISAPGLFDQHDEEFDDVIDEFGELLERLPHKVRLNDEELVDNAKMILRRILGRRLKKKPMVDIHLLRL